MPLPDDPRQWPEDWRHAWEERAAIHEFEAGMSRERAERMAESALRRLRAIRERKGVAQGRGM